MRPPHAKSFTLLHANHTTDARTSLCNLALSNRAFLFLIQLIWLFISYLNLEPALMHLKWIIWCPHYKTTNEGGPFDYRHLRVVKKTNQIVIKGMIKVFPQAPPSFLSNRRTDQRAL